MKTAYLDSAIPNELVALGRCVAIERGHDDLINGLQPLERLQEKYLVKLDELRACFALNKERVWYYRKASGLLYYASCSDAQSPSQEFASACYVDALAVLADPKYAISQKEAEASALALYRLRVSRPYRKDKETSEQRAAREATENAAIQAAIDSISHWPGLPLQEVAEIYGIPVPTLYYAHKHRLIPSRQVGDGIGKGAIILIDPQDYLWYAWYGRWRNMQERKHGKER